jgi:hypothetical protein
VAGGTKLGLNPGQAILVTGQNEEGRQADIRRHVPNPEGDRRRSKLRQHPAAPRAVNGRRVDALARLAPRWGHVPERHGIPLHDLIDAVQHGFDQRVAGTHSVRGLAEQAKAGWEWHREVGADQFVRHPEARSRNKIVRLRPQEAGGRRVPRTGQRQPFGRDRGPMTEDLVDAA